MMRTSNCPAACRNSAPFLSPAQPTPMTVCASKPHRSRAKSMGIDSSSRTRTGHYLVACELKRGDGLFAAHRRELMQKLVETIASFEIIEERLHGHARAHEHRRAAEAFRVAMYDVLGESQRGGHS